MSDKAYVIAVHDMNALLKLTVWLEKSTTDISSFRGIFCVIEDINYYNESHVILISADRGDLQESIEDEFQLGKWNASFHQLNDFGSFFSNSKELLNENSISEKDFMIETFEIYFSEN